MLMKTHLLKLLLLTTAFGCGLLRPHRAAAQTIDYTGGTLTENFNSMGPAGTNTPPGWFVGYAGPTNLTAVAVNDGSVPPNGTAAWNFGSAGSTNRALGTMATSTGSAAPNDSRYVEARIRNRTGQSLGRITVSYSGVQWRTASTATNTTLVLQFSLDGTNFELAGAAFNFTQPTLTPLSRDLNGNEATNRVAVIPPDGTIFLLTPVIPPDGTIFLRWFDANDAGTTDPALAIDNFSFSAAPGVPAPVIAYTGGTLMENFDSMGTNGTNTPPGWYVGYAGPSDRTNLGVNDGSLAPNGTAAWNFGTSNNTDRALGTMATGTGTPVGTRYVEARIRNLTGQSLASVTVSYSGEQWRTGSTVTDTNTLVLQYSADGRNYVNMGAAFNFTQRTFTPLSSALDGNQSANRADVIPPDGTIFLLAPVIPPDGTIFLRWFDFNDAGIDPALAIDNFAFSASAVQLVNCACLDMLPELRTNACQAFIPNLCQFTQCLLPPGAPCQCTQSPAPGPTPSATSRPATCAAPDSSAP